MKLSKAAIFSVSLMCAIASHTPLIFAEEITDPNLLRFVGTWETYERVYPDTEREYIETGIRTCTLVMDNSYIQCDTKATARGRERTTRTMIHYNDSTQQVEIVAVFSNVPFKGMYMGNFDETGTVLSTRSYEILLEGLRQGSDNVFTFDGDDQFTWEVYRWADEEHTQKNYIGIETAKRID